MNPPRPSDESLAMSLQQSHLLETLDYDSSDDHDTAEILANSRSNRVAMLFIARFSLYSLLCSPVWFICTVLLLSIIYINQVSLLSYDASQRCAPPPAGSGAYGHATEFDQVAPAIELSQVRFDGAIRDHSNGSLYFHWDSDEPRYSISSGATLDEVDDSWENLLFGRYVRLTAAEVDWMNADNLNPALMAINGSDVAEGIYGGPDMLHSLHCLNGLRQALHMDRYAKDIWMTEEMRVMHNDHCVEQLRQAILCHGDMTPVTIKPVIRDGTVRVWLGETERPHTCRNGMQLKEWWRQRGERTGRIPY